eukprot:jgi/Psemu1/33451/gm1.33451_g
MDPRLRFAAAVQAHPVQTGLPDTMPPPTSMSTSPPSCEHATGTAATETATAGGAPQQQPQPHGADATDDAQVTVFAEDVRFEMAACLGVPMVPAQALLSPKVNGRLSSASPRSNVRHVLCSDAKNKNRTGGGGGTGTDTTTTTATTTRWG